MGGRSSGNTPTISKRSPRGVRLVSETAAGPAFVGVSQSLPRSSPCCLMRPARPGGCWGLAETAADRTAAAHRRRIARRPPGGPLGRFERRRPEGPGQARGGSAPRIRRAGRLRVTLETMMQRRHRGADKGLARRAVAATVVLRQPQARPNPTGRRSWFRQPR